MTSHINLIEASVQARAQWWGAEDTPCSLEGRHSQFQLGLNSEDGWSKKNTGHRFVHVGMSEEIIPELFWSPMVAMVPALEKCAQWFSPLRKQFGRCAIYKQRIVNRW